MLADADDAVKGVAAPHVRNGVGGSLAALTGAWTEMASSQKPVRSRAYLPLPGINLVALK